MTTKRTGRRPGPNETREEILRAARAEFAAKGFQGATTRAIADAAGVNVALLAHYFGGKRQLFAAALELSDTVREQLVIALDGDRDAAARGLARAYLGLWEDPISGAQLLAIVRSSLASGEATESMRELLTGIVRLSSEAPEREAGLALALSHLLGTAVARHITKVEPVVALPFEELVERVTPAIAAHLS